MAQYIDKDALVAEIERRIKSINSCPFRTAELGSEKLNEGQLKAYNVILSFIDTLELKEVDLEKEIDNWYSTMGIPVTVDALKETARHFFELGLKAKNK